MNYFIQFLGRLLIVNILLSFCMYFVHLIPELKPYSDLSFYSICMFSVMSIILYLFLRNSLFNKDKQVFISITLGNMLVRMLGSIILLLIYRNICLPADSKFIISFLIVYVVFTIFETYFMVSLADIQQDKNKS